MAATDPGDSSPASSGFGNEPVLTLLADISGNLKDLNVAPKDHSIRFLKLENERIGDKSTISRPEYRRRAGGRRGATRRLVRLRKPRVSRCGEQRSYEEDTEAEDEDGVVVGEIAGVQGDSSE
jgi:hypothetical protein